MKGGIIKTKKYRRIKNGEIFNKIIELTSGKYAKNTGKFLYIMLDLERGRKMQYIDISEFVKPQPVLINNFSTHMLFRCTSREFAEDLCNGKLYLSTPRVWVEKEMENGKGQGDSIEGVFYGTNVVEGNPILKSFEKNPDIEVFKHEGYTFLRRMSVLDMRCACFYGLHDKDFRKIIDSDGKAHFKRVIPVSYFTDFSQNIMKEDYNNLPSKSQPVVVIIDKPHIFFEKVRSALHRIGVEDRDIIISPVEYIEMHKHHYSALEFPKELLLKDVFFERQSEVRIIVSSKNKAFHDYLKKHNNKIEIGSLDGITSILDYYFHDLEIEKDKNRISYTLPKSEVKSFMEMNFSELLETLRNIYNGYYGLSNEEEEEAIEQLKDVVLQKYNTHLYISGHEIIMDRVPEEYVEEFNNLASIYTSIQKFNVNINSFIKENKIDEAIELCKNSKANRELFIEANYRLVHIYKDNNLYKEMLQQIEFCVNEGIKEIEVLDIRWCYYYDIGEYELAIADLELLQEYMGYNIMIYGNKGIGYIALGRNQDAIYEFNKAIEMNSCHAFSFYNRGVAYFRLNELEKAKRDIEEAIRLEPYNEYFVSEYEKCFPKIEDTYN